MFGMQNINKANPSPLLAKPGCKKKKKKQVRQKAQPISSPEEFVNTWLFSVTISPGSCTVSESSPTYHTSFLVSGLLGREAHKDSSTLGALHLSAANVNQQLS